jgi:hypothetical protein
MQAATEPVRHTHCHQSTARPKMRAAFLHGQTLGLSASPEARRTSAGADDGSQGVLLWALSSCLPASPPFWGPHSPTTNPWFRSEAVHAQVCRLRTHVIIQITYRTEYWTLPSIRQQPTQATPLNRVYTHSGELPVHCHRAWAPSYVRCFRPTITPIPAIT